MKKAKLKAVQEGISLKELFTRSLEKELSTSSAAPWKQLHGKGSAENLTPEESGFEGYTGPDWNHDIRLNEPDE